MKIDHFLIMDVVAEPRTPLQNLVHELEYFCDELYAIGDAMIPRNLYNAVHEGYKVEVRI
jgi:2,4-dienoyl-CoA reductase (NADPH2)